MQKHPLPYYVFLWSKLLFGQYLNDMNLFASSGAIISVFGLLYTIKFTTLKKLSNREAEINSRSGVTGPPLSAGRITKDTRRKLS
ncbi:hypothetical protein JFC01_24460 [Shigella sonnei]|nr:hypothetical protein [Shigella sonnei]